MDTLNFKRIALNKNIEDIKREQISKLESSNIEESISVKRWTPRFDEGHFKSVRAESHKFKEAEEEPTFRYKANDELPVTEEDVLGATDTLVKNIEDSKNPSDVLRATADFVDNLYPSETEEKEETEETDVEHKEKETEEKEDIGLEVLKREFAPQEEEKDLEESIGNHKHMSQSEVSLEAFNDDGLKLDVMTESLEDLHKEGRPSSDNFYVVFNDEHEPYILEYHKNEEGLCTPIEAYIYDTFEDDIEYHTYLYYDHVGNQVIEEFGIKDFESIFTDKNFKYWFDCDIYDVLDYLNEEEQTSEYSSYEDAQKFYREATENKDEDEKLQTLYHVFGTDGERLLGPHVFNLKTFYRSKEKALKIAKYLSENVDKDITIIVKKEVYNKRGFCVSCKEIWGSLLGSMEEKKIRESHEDLDYFRVLEELEAVTSIEWYFADEDGYYDVCINSNIEDENLQKVLNSLEREGFYHEFEVMEGDNVLKFYTLDDEEDELFESKLTESPRQISVKGYFYDWAAPYFINGDKSGFSEGDLVESDEYLEKVFNTTGCWNCVDVSEETEYGIPSIDGVLCREFLKGDLVEYTFIGFNNKKAKSSLNEGMEDPICASYVEGNWTHVIKKMKDGTFRFYLGYKPSGDEKYIATQGGFASLEDAEEGLKQQSPRAVLQESKDLEVKKGYSSTNQSEISVDFTIPFSSKGRVNKSTMIKVFKHLASIDEELAQCVLYFKEGDYGHNWISHDFFIKDENGRETLWTVESNDDTITIDCELTVDETETGDDCYNCLEVYIGYDIDEEKSYVQYEYYYDYC